MGIRLIDADKLIGVLKNDSGSMLEESLLGIVEGQPTAYDVDKVVEQLEECKRIMLSPVSQDCYGEECKVGDCLVCTFEKAIEIVKAGGVSE